LPFAIAEKTLMPCLLSLHFQIVVVGFGEKHGSFTFQSGIEDALMSCERVQAYLYLLLVQITILQWTMKNSCLFQGFKSDSRHGIP